MKLKRLNGLRALFLVIFYIGSAHANPNLVVHPTRITFDKNQRAAQVDLSNTGDQSATYRITIENKRMDESGKFTLAETPLPGEFFADSMIQYSPRQVVLGPGSGQTVRLSLRKPENLPPGEYRSHLTFARIPDANLTSIENTNKPKGNEIGIVLTALVGVSIPVIVRHGETSARVAISNPKFQPAGKEPAILAVKLERSGNQSSYGDLIVNAVSLNGEKKIGVATGVAVYSPNPSRVMKVVLRPEDVGVELTHQKLHIIYREQEQAGGKLLAEADLQIP